jgi:hypothetical protein
MPAQESGGGVIIFFGFDLVCSAQNGIGAASAISPFIPQFFQAERQGFGQPHFRN